MEKTNNPEIKEDALAQVSSAVLSKVENLSAEELDFVGQKFPNMKPGSRGMVYLLLAIVTLLPPVQAAWAVMGFLVVPYGFAVANIGMFLRLVTKGKNEEHAEWEREQRGEEEEEFDYGSAIEVPVREVEEDDDRGSGRRRRPIRNTSRDSVSREPGPEVPMVDKHLTPPEPSGSTGSEIPEFEPSPWARPSIRKKAGPGFQAPEPEPRVMHRPPLRSELPPAPTEDVLSPSETKSELAKFLAPPVEEVVRIPLPQRAERLLNDLEMSGCDLWSYVDDPILVCQGTQQSGKSTLAVIVSILEAARYGKRINYITSNGDIYPVAFAAVGDGPEYYLQLAEYLKTLGKDQGGEDIWITDEISKQSYETTSALWNQYLSDFVKTGDTARIIAHGTSATDMGLPKGRSTQSKKEITILAAKRKVDVVGKKKARALSKGGRYPSGQYQLQELQGENLVDVPEERVQLPDWLLFDSYIHPRTRETIPCYVRSLLKYFPEFDIRAGAPEPRVLFEEAMKSEEVEPVEESSTDATPEIPAHVRTGLENLLTQVEDDPLKDASELAQKLYAWITTGAGTKFWQQVETKTATLTIVDRENIISKGNRHWVGGATKSFHAFELADAVSDLVAIRKLSKTKEGHVVIKTVWKDKEV